MDWLTFAAICIVVVPWQVLAFIVVNAVIKYTNTIVAATAVTPSLAGLIERVQKNPSEIWRIVTEYIGLPTQPVKRVRNNIDTFV